MSFPKALGASLALLGILYGFQLPFREFPGVEYRVGDISLPPDYQEKTEWAFARLMYPPSPYGGRGGRGFGFRGGGFGHGPKATPCGPRTTRAPTATSCRPLRRLTRLHVRSVEQPVNLDEGGVYDWPWLYAVQTGHWALDRFAGEDSARIPAARRLLHGGRFLGRPPSGRFSWTA